MQIHPAHGIGAAAREPQRHTIQIDAAVALRQRHGMLGGLDLWCPVEDLEDALAGGHRALRHAERIAEGAHGPKEREHVAVEGGELADGERAAHHGAAADEQHERQPDLGRRPISGL